MLHNAADARRLLQRLGAPDRLLLHLELVGEAASELITAYRRLAVPFDNKLIELGVAVHDAGKIKHPQELDAPGSLHEPAGEALLLAHGVQAEVARCCVSHAAWHEAGTSFEELSVALADKLWKGKREQQLELKVIDGVAARLGVQRWAVFAELDAVFETIADGGAQRLNRSRG
jgi:hypothetical protein